MKICRSIESFTKHFSNLVLEQKKAGVKDIFEMESELNLPKNWEIILNSSKNI